MARMPSTRSQPLNPRVAAGTTPAAKTPAKPAAPAAPANPEPPVNEQEEAQRAGGFHESSYELKHGLEVNESEWPADTTIPGALGDR